MGRSYFSKTSGLQNMVGYKYSLNFQVCLVPTCTQLFTSKHVQPAMLFVWFKHGVFVAFLETNQSLRHHLPKLEKTEIKIAQSSKHIYIYIVYRKVSHPSTSHAPYVLHRNRTLVPFLSITPCPPVAAKTPTIFCLYTVFHHLYSILPNLV